MTDIETDRYEFGRARTSVNSLSMLPLTTSKFPLTRIRS